MTARGPCTGWTSRAAACGSRARPPRPAARGRRRVLDQRRRRHARRPGDDPPARPRVRGRPARPDPARDALARAPLDLPDDRGAARDRAAAVAELPPLPPRRLRRLRRALGRPEGDAFGRAARRFEELGVAALLINCIPPTTPPACSRGFATSPTFRSASTPTSGTCPRPAGATSAPCTPTTSPSSRSPGARRARRSSAAAAASAPSTSPPRAPRSRGRGRATGGSRRAASRPGRGARPAAARAALERPLRTRALPLPFPEIGVEDGVVVPNQASLLVWKHLWRERIGEGARCLDIGCGSGLQAVQLALNGATHGPRAGHRPAAVRNTLTNAFRNGVADRVQAEHRRPLPVGPRRSLRRRRRDPDAAAARPVRAACHPPAPRLLGPQPLRPHDPAAARDAGAARASRYVLQLSLIGAAARRSRASSAQGCARASSISRSSTSASSA